MVGGWTPGEGNARELGRGRRRGYDGRQAPVRPARSAPGSTHEHARISGRGWMPWRHGRPPVRPAARRRDYAAAGAAISRVSSWVRPELVIRAELGGWSREGFVRQASFKGIRDRSPSRRRSCARIPSRRRRPWPSCLRRPRAAHLEKLPTPRAPGVQRRRRRGAGGADGSTARKQPDPKVRCTFTPGRRRPPNSTRSIGSGREGVWHVGGYELKLTNLDKPLFPPAPATPDDPPITKRELIRYFAPDRPDDAPAPRRASAQPASLPERRVRQEFLAEGHPEDRARRGCVAGTRSASKPRDANEHLIADRVGALCWLGNQASFEVHAWTSRLDAPWRPTFALIDIDPGEKTTWEETLVLARLYRTALGHLGVRGYPKDDRQARHPGLDPDRRALRLQRHERVGGAAVDARSAPTVPDLVSWEWAKGDRGGKARLDYTQNASIKTLVAPYAVRPAAGAPVSAPIDWDELDDPGLRAGPLDDPDDRGPRRGTGDLFAPPRPTCRSCRAWVDEPVGPIQRDRSPWGVRNRPR